MSMFAAIVLGDEVERLRAELAELQQLYRDRQSDLSFEFARAERAEARLRMMQSEMNKIARNLGQEIELLARAERAEAALAERDKPCIWKHGYGDAWRGFTFCPVCGHRIEVQP